MALIKCPECELQVSDKALSCPHCGYPMKEDVQKKGRGKAKPKRMRLPNGFGSITKLTGANLRKPYWVRVCIGKTETGKPIQKPLKPESLFETYQDAYEALVEYNKNPYDLEPDITVEELFEKWTDEYFETASDSYIRTVKSAWTYCSSIYRMRAKDVAPRHIKGVMEDGYIIPDRGKDKGQKRYPSAGTKTKIKSLFNIMFDYAVEYEIVDINPARRFEVSDDVLKEIKNNKVPHIKIPKREMEILWDNVDRVKFVDWVLIQCYMGWRPQEMALLELSEVNLKRWTITGGIKTDAGKQRTVPIHSRIQYLVKRNYDFAVSIGSPYLFNDKGQTHAGSWKLTYDKYANRFKSVISALNLNPEHRAHDPRVTFTTMAKKAEIDEYAIKAMVGHRIKDITESVYTTRDIEWLRNDIEKIKIEELDF